ncbi:MAG: argininosuccinate synthase [Dehalococcoidia bacterium]|nr:argininosuccinate synthase [Dehalococcoidia bacterium]
MSDKVILAYSGGLDTSVAIKWIQEKYDMEVVTFTADLGNDPDLEAIRQRALDIGAVKALVADVREEFVREFVFPALKAGAVYEGEYPLSTALARPLIARCLAETALKEGATAVAHGCTGKGNDQVRFDVSIGSLAPELKIIAPVRDSTLSREEALEYATLHKLPIKVTKASPYSIDQNLWGRSIECGILEDPWAEPPEDAFAWTRSPQAAPDQPAYLEISFQAGVPVGLDGQALGPVELIARLTSLAGEHGVGRIDHVENRLVGIKSREVYEMPAAMVLLKAHRTLESLTLSKDQLRFKDTVAATYSDLVYNGLWFSALRRDLDAFVESTQRFVTGEVRVKLFKGTCAVVGRKSPYSLYSHGLATYDRADQFDHSAAVGFIQLWGLPHRIQRRVQGETEKPTPTS